MNIVFVSDNCQEAEFLKQELSGNSPAIRVDISPNAENALFRFVTPGNCDVILLDESVSDAEAVDLIETIRNEKKPIGVVAMVGADKTELPTDLYYAGADRFILKRQGYIASLVEAMKEAKERHPSDLVPGVRHARLFYAGDKGNTWNDLNCLPFMTLESLEISPEGLLPLPDAIAFPGDLIVIDSERTADLTLKAIKEIQLHETGCFHHSSDDSGR